MWESSDEMYKCQTAGLWNATYDILRLDAEIRFPRLFLNEVIFVHLILSQTQWRQLQVLI